MAIGYTLPFKSTVSSQGAIAYTSTEMEATFYNLKSLLLTDWGERPNHLHYGCNLTAFLFEPNTLDLQSRIREIVMTQAATWLPYVQINDVIVEVNTFEGSSTNTIKLKVNFSLNGNSANLVVQVPN